MSTSLSVARSYVGVCEDPPGSNRGEHVERFLKLCGIAPPAPWCAAFVYACIAEAAKSSGCANPFAKVEGKAWTPSWLAWANAHSEMLTGRRAKSLADSGRRLFDADCEPARLANPVETAPSALNDDGSPHVLTPGMFFLLYYPKLKRVAHIGFIASPLDALMLVERGGNSLAIGARGYASRLQRRIEPAQTNDAAKVKLEADAVLACKTIYTSGLVATIEGNTDPAGSRTGGGVFVRTRKLAGMHRIAMY